MQCVSPFNESMSSREGGDRDRDGGNTDRRSGYPAYTSLDSPTHQESMMSKGDHTTTNTSTGGSSKFHCVSPHSHTSSGTDYDGDGSATSPFHPMRKYDGDSEQSSSRMETPTSISNNSTFLLGASNSSNRYNNYSQVDLFDDASNSTRGGGATTPSNASFVSGKSRASGAVTPTVNNTTPSGHNENNNENNNSTSMAASLSSSMHQSIAMMSSFVSPRSSSYATNNDTTTTTTPQSSLMDTMHLASSSDDDDDSGVASEASSGSRGDKNNSSPSWRRSTGTTPTSNTTTARTSRGMELRQSAPPTVRQFPSVTPSDHNNSDNNNATNKEPAPKYYHPAYWNSRLARKEVYSRRYRPSNPEVEEMSQLEEWLGIQEARKMRKTILVQQWMQLNPSQALAASQNSPVSIVLKRGPVAWSSHNECELILLTRGFVLARQVFEYIPRFKASDLWTNVEKVMPTGLTSFAIVCGAMKTLEFHCGTISEQQAWMNALRVVVLQAHTHSVASQSSQRGLHNIKEDDDDDDEKNPLDLGWQYLLVQTPWFSEAVTGHVRLDSNMLDQMDNRHLNELDSYNQCAPLHYATRANHVDAMRFLLQAGADPNQEDGMGRTPVQYAEEEELPQSTVELLESYGGKGPNASDNQRTCFFIPVKDTSRKYRYFTMAILLLLLVGTGLATFLVLYLGKDNDTNSASSIESSGNSPTSSADRTTPPDTVDDDEEESATTTPPPFLVVGVNPIPATNLSTLSPYPTFSSNTSPATTPTATPTLVNASGSVNETAAVDLDQDSLNTETGFNPDELEETTSDPSTEKTSPSPSPSVATGEPSALLTTSTPTSMTTSAISTTDVASDAVSTFSPTNTATDAITFTPSTAATEAATTDLPTGHPTEGSTLAPTWAPTNVNDGNDASAVGAPTNFPTFETLQNQENDFLPEDILLFEFLVEKSLDRGAGLRNPKSDQYRAFRWLSGNMYLSSYSEERKIQRFALATLYYSTNGDEWINNQNWLSDQDECTAWFSRIAEIASNAVCNMEEQMITLDLDYNNIQGSLPLEVALLSHLRRMELYGGPQGYITGTLPSELALLSDLQSLSVRGNQLNGTVFTEIGYLRNLENLNLSLNKIGGEIPTTLGLLTMLTSLSMDTNALFGHLPSELGNISSLRSITSGNNLITGQLPTELGLLPDLRGLDLEMTQLSSTLPTELGLLSNLSLLHLTISGLQGPIPSEVGGLLSLESLHLRGNSLTSSIPSQLGLLVNLGSVDLSFAQLSGKVPTEIGEVSLLRSLSLNSNSLSGQVPSEMAKLSRLNTLRMDLNNLTGTVPNEVCDVFFVTYPTFYADCGIELECPCCTYCCVDEAGCVCEYAGTVDEFLC